MCVEQSHETGRERWCVYRESSRASFDGVKVSGTLVNSARQCNASISAYCGSCGAQSIIGGRVEQVYEGCGSGTRCSTSVLGNQVDHLHVSDVICITLIDIKLTCRIADVGGIARLAS